MCNQNEYLSITVIVSCFQSAIQLENATRLFHRCTHSIVNAFYNHVFSSSRLCLFFGTCWIFHVLGKDIKSDFSILMIGAVSQRKDKEFSRHFCALIQRYSDMKQLSADSLCIINDQYPYFFYERLRFCAKLSVEFPNSQGQICNETSYRSGLTVRRRSRY